VLCAASLAHAGDAKTERSNGKLVAADAAAKTIVVSEKGKELTYSVTPEGSVLTRTTVTLNGKASPFSALAPGMPVIVYWKPDTADATKRYARKIDVPRIPPEFQDDVDQAARDAASQ
jgi:hypothetical protein